ncbi:MAG: SH3 domain-containing protein [Phycisphaerae bacterium]|nr:SH3 domain-containing protein [Phycisphaerae bacterium]
MSRARWIAAAVLVFVSTQDLFAQTGTSGSAASAAPRTAFPWEGEVSGTNVRVRSGPGTNFYATTKVNTGDRLLVLGVRDGWYEIAPPRGSFSYVDTADVDREGMSNRGTVKKERIFARAGSELAASKSTNQIALTRGTRVEIIGEVDGFFKIYPPAGAKLYISTDFVRPVANDLRTGLAERYLAGLEQTPAPEAAARNTAAPVRNSSASTATPGGVSPAPSNAPVDEPNLSRMNEPAAEEEEESEGMEGAEPSVNDDDAMVDELPPIETDRSIQALKEPKDERPRRDVPAAPMNKTSGRYQALLTAVESDLHATMLLPLEERDLDSLVHRYGEIANQSDERVPSEYAKIRVSQLQTMSDVRKARASAVARSSDIDAFKARMTSERMQIMRARAEKVTEKFDFVGELRKSYAFAPEKRRYRLVDVKRQTTIAYIDIPRDISENPEYMVGRTVGIRTSGQRYSMAARIPIAVAASLTDLTPPAENAGGTLGESAGKNSIDIAPPPLEDKPTTPDESSGKAPAKTE